jgi:CHAD domain-containing protein
MANTTTEVERKYETPAGFELPDLSDVPGVVIVDEPSLLQLDAIYFDTSDMRLADHHVTLRRRTGGHDAGWHVKRPAGADRSESHEPLADGDDGVPATVAAQVADLTGGQPLEPVARIRNHRQERSIRGADGAVLALIAEDAVSADALADPPRNRQWRELEVELVDGPRALLDLIEAKLRSAGARPAASPSKLAQALGDRYPQAASVGRPGNGPKGGPTDEPDDGRSRRAVIDYLAEQRDAVRTNDPLVRAGDPDGVHDMRVAIRRLRATLRTFRTFLPRGYTDPLRDDLRWLGDQLGPVRDGDILARRLGRATALLATETPDLMVGPVAVRIRERLAVDEVRARRDLATAMDSARYADLSTALDRLANLDLPDVSRKQVLRRVRHVLSRADSRLDRARRAPAAPTGAHPADAAPGDGDVALHEARKACKRARYAVELVTPIIGRPARRLSTRLGTVQDVLGAHQDAVIAAGLLRDIGSRAQVDGENAFTCGLLFARERADAAAQLTALDEARRRAGRRKLRRRLVS